MEVRKAGFKKDIEGLRAIAILLVIGAHFALPYMDAGFIGVDIFFVISGFLITGILVKEYNANQTISLSQFYANRFRRLFPALATMLVASSFAAYYILPETQQLKQSHAAASAVAWVSNIYFTFADADYFGAENTLNLFLHTWSLGVEEQFYLVWPLLIFIGLKLALKPRSMKGLILLFIIIFSTSFAACVYLSNQHSVFTFYMMPTRAWQFSAGALTWFLTHRNVGAKSSQQIGVIGVLLLVTSLVIINTKTLYPSYIALLPTLSACMLLFSGHNQNTSTYKTLSTKPLQWIGRLSYSWYLWHWPVLLLAEQLIPVKGNPNNTILVFLISLCLAFVTHHAIENPIRFGKIKNLKPSWQIGLTIFLMVLINSQFLRWYSTTQSSLENDQSARYIKAINDIPFFYQDGCDSWYHDDELKPCVYGDKHAKNTAVLLGDSIGAQWFPTLTQLYSPSEWKLIVLTKSSCPIVDEPYFYERIGREYTECSSWRNKAIDWLQKQSINTLYIGSVASTPFSDTQWQAGTQRILNKLANVPEIYLIESNPVLGFNGPDCLLKNKNNPEKCLVGTADNSNYQHVAALLQNTVKEISNARWIETASYVCPNNVCSAIQNEIIVYRDAQHLTASFTASAAEHFKHQMEQHNE